MNGMNLIDLWNRFQAEERHKAKMAEWRKLSTDELKALWDEFWQDVEPDKPGYFWPENAPHLEDVHALLNERGEGKYCAV